MTLDTYSHVLPSMQQEAMDKWDTLFAPGELTLSHEAEQPCELCVKYNIHLPRVLHDGIIYINDLPEKHTVQNISIHHPMELREQRHLDATGYAEIGHDILMVRTTFCTGILAWEPV
jgi:hypothetical protein